MWSIYIYKCKYRTRTRTRTRTRRSRTTRGSSSVRAGAVAPLSAAPCLKKSNLIYTEWSSPCYTKRRWEKKHLNRRCFAVAQKLRCRTPSRPRSFSSELFLQQIQLVGDVIDPPKFWPRLPSLRFADQAWEVQFWVPCQYLPGPSRSFLADNSLCQAPFESAGFVYPTGDVQVLALLFYIVSGTLYPLHPRLQFFAASWVF